MTMNPTQIFSSSESKLVYGSIMSKRGVSEELNQCLEKGSKEKEKVNKYRSNGMVCFHVEMRRSP